MAFSVRLLEANEARLCPGCSLSLVKLTDIIDILRSGFLSPTFELCRSEILAQLDGFRSKTIQFFDNFACQTLVLAQISPQLRKNLKPQALTSENFEKLNEFKPETVKISLSKYIVQKSVKKSLTSKCL